MPLRIDTHQHFWQYQAAAYGWISDAMPALQRDCLPGDVAPAMAAAGVDAAVAVQARCTPAETDALLRLAALNPQILGVVGWLDLRAPDFGDQLADGQALAAGRLRGLRHILQDEADVPGWLATPQVASSMRQLQDRQLTYDVLVYQHQLAWVQGFCARHDRHWLVLDHLGKPAIARFHEDAGAFTAWRQALAPLAAMPHVGVKLSGLVTETAWPGRSGLEASDCAVIRRCFDVALELFGPHRLLFGSDWPVCQLAAPYDQVAGLVEAWAASRLSPSEQNALWGDNALRVYGLAG